MATVLPFCASDSKTHGWGRGEEEMKTHGWQSNTTDVVGKAMMR